MGRGLPEYKKVNQTYPKDQFGAKVKGDYDSILVLIKRRNDIKAAIVESNAKTIVKVDGVDMTVAAAIERKDSIEYEKTLLEQMRIQYNAAVATTNRENDKVSVSLDNFITSMLGKEGRQKATEEELDAVTKPYKDQNDYEVLNPIDIHDKITALQKQIDGFEAEVDAVLSESNAITKITIED
jgi:hypothetical protein